MNWREELRSNITKAEELRGYLKLNDEETSRLEAILEHFPMTITRYYLSLINWDDPKDPIRRMCIPSIEENDMTGKFDTSGEADNTVLPGLQHKYNETVLILSTHRCAMYCRHCFRKRLVGISDDETADNVAEMADYIRQHAEISNALISGGDAFLNSNAVIRRYLEQFSDIEHLDLIRFGTRTPVVLPARIYDDPELLETLQTYSQRKKIYVVTQFNHPAELTGEAKKAVDALLNAGVVLKNQTVLLKGVNDDGRTMGELLKGLTRWGIAPYYIFQCRPPGRGIPDRGGGQAVPERPRQMRALRDEPCDRKDRNPWPVGRQPDAVQIPPGQIRPRPEPNLHPGVNAGSDLAGGLTN